MPGHLRPRTPSRTRFTYKASMREWQPSGLPTAFTLGYDWTRRRPASPCFGIQASKWGLRGDTTGRQCEWVVSGPSNSMREPHGQTVVLGCAPSTRWLANSSGASRVLVALSRHIASVPRRARPGGPVAGIQVQEYVSRPGSPGRGPPVSKGQWTAPDAPMAATPLSSSNMVYKDVPVTRLLADGWVSGWPRTTSSNFLERNVGNASSTATVQLRGQNTKLRGRQSWIKHGELRSRYDEGDDQSAWGVGDERREYQTARVEIGIDFEPNDFRSWIDLDPECLKGLEPIQYPA
ncbi:hypothetical protein C8Q80DRAFT_1341654 [Daedaleopsis nitida]|nr:hypothetical protein C8Q80DRAFT_1341654 [Daedaleopsis nitida]